jgi:SAM-dependent methyltransferase
VLDALAEVTYEGVDYSQPMLDLGASRLREYADRVRFTRADLVADRWDQVVKRPVGAVVSTWALHDLGGEENTAKVYRACKLVLPPGGIFLNGDFIKPEAAKFDYEPGRFAVARHIEILSELGFQGVECLGVFETELDDPTPAQNYALIKAVG